MGPAEGALDGADVGVGDGNGMYVTDTAPNMRDEATTVADCKKEALWTRAACCSDD